MGVCSKVTSTLDLVPLALGTVYVKARHGPCIDSQKALSWLDSLQLRLGRLN